MSICRRLAHNGANGGGRSSDVAPTSQVETFEALLLSKRTLSGLNRTGFQQPSPIQAKAIPMAKCGVDMIIQAKSGTGKTCVFAVVSLEMVNVQLNQVQVVILAPTREIAIQICDNINCIGVDYPGLKCFAFIGGIALEQDKVKIRRCHIFVGTPGRTKQLLQVGLLKTRSIRLFVLDEADKLLEPSFHDDINSIFAALPANKQMLALSATFPSEIVSQLSKYMRAPTVVRLNSDDPVLLGIRQFYHSVPYHSIPHIIFQRKLKVLLQILVDVPYTQCLIFLNSQMRAEMLCDRLRESNFPCELLSGAQRQSERIRSLVQLKQNRCRILVTTDLAARGIDAEKISVVINFEVPNDKETYLHRIGRAGRYGSFGIAVSIAAEGTESDALQKITTDSNVLLQFIGTLRDFRHILTVTNEPVPAEGAIINHVRYPPTPQELTPAEDESRTPLTSMSSESNCSSRGESRPGSRASSRCPSRKSSLRRKQAIRNFVTTQSEPCTPFHQRSNSNNSVNFDPVHTSWNELHLVEKIQKAFTPSCEDLHLGSIDEALESLARVRTAKMDVPKFNGSLVWDPLMKPHIDLTPLAPPEEEMLEETSDEESQQDNSVIQTNDLTPYAIRPKYAPFNDPVTNLRKGHISQSLNCLARIEPTLLRQSSFTGINPSYAGLRVPNSVIGARWESQACLSNMYNRYIKSMLYSRSSYFQKTN
ncbi:probable ATP-dependent RNA helicase DDX20 [Varroa jacobsoni]|uniref:RNA helicase n=1 Tax=Varroa destructor TaxID=109461 RepID=A0A7M7KS88_VARDE|nr:probable ATP-dependent RNA helicase DDX20 [Varroa destructor]XP_022691291.1 probable ATP-dependent RNA helicase DDX20 [Varroa jacobsoni]XP_022691375.1 probable ATP-dependent RNA helicase DDX20 [Varroa jacobsoni]